MFDGEQSSAPGKITCRHGAPSSTRLSTGMVVVAGVAKGVAVAAVWSGPAPRKLLTEHGDMVFGDESQRFRKAV
jgi:hypothetical protein